MAQLHAGFHMSDITPKTGGIPLGGWGSTHLRLAAKIGYPLTCSITALGNSEKPEFLLINVDFLNIYDKIRDSFREAASKATGVPAMNITVSGTHTHSGPDNGSNLDTIKKYLEYLPSVVGDCAARAVADMKPATVFYGKNEVGKPGTRLNFVRHYTMTDIEFKDHPEDGPVYFSGNNFGFEYNLNPDKYIYTGHESEADPEVLLVELRRENADSILLVNFQSHALISSGVASTLLTADFPGPLCRKLEKDIPNVKAVYIQGCCGNINPYTRIREEALLGINFDPFTENDDCENSYIAYGEIIAAYVKEIYESKLIESKSNVLKFTDKLETCICDHTNDHRVPEVLPVIEKFNAEGNTREVIAFAQSKGLNSPYHAIGINNRSKLPESMDVEVHAVSIGDCAMVTAPFEVYDQIGMEVKAKSPFPCTLMQCYSCGSKSYLPAEGTVMTSYERNATLFMPGTAEQIGAAQLELLNKLKK